MKNAIVELRRKQNDALREMDEIDGRAGTENRALTADESKRYAELQQSVKDLQASVEREEFKATYRVGPNGTPVANTESPNIGMGERDLSAYSLLRAVRAAATGDWRDAGLEREASDAVAKRLGKTPQGFFIPMDWMESKHSATPAEHRAVTPTSGANLIPTNLGSFIDVLRNRAMVRAAGAVFLTGLVGNVDLPKRTAGAALTWVATGVAPGAEATQTITAVQLRPKTGAAYIDIYRTTMLQSSLDVEMLMRDDLASAVQIGLDAGSLHGTGSNNQPTGIAATSGIGSVAGGTDGAAPTWTHVVGLETEVAIDNADAGRLAYMTNPKVRGKLKQTAKVSSTDSKMVWNDDAQVPLNGYPAFVTNQVASNLVKGGSGAVCSAIFFGNWSDLIVGLWGTIDITADIPDNRTGTVRVAALVDADIAVRNAQSFAAMLDALTS